MAMIPQTVIDDILSRSNIVEIINSFVPLQKAGAGRWKACCPFHQEKTPSFHVDENKQMYYCFGCQKGGNVVTFLKELQNLSYPEALHFLADRYNVVIPTTFSPEEEREFQHRRSLENRLYDLHREIAAFFMRELRNNPQSAVAQYFQKRAIPQEYADKFQIGAAPDSWDATLRYGKSLGFSEEEMLASGIALQSEKSQGRLYDRFRNRLVFSIWDDQGRVVGFSARTIEAQSEGAKYVNSPETAIFKKSKLLYAFHLAKNAIRQSKFAILCEGQLDTIAMHRAGLDMAVAPQGLAFGVEQAALLKRYTDTLYLAFDSDKAGQAGTQRVLEFLLPMGFEIRALSIAGGKDPDELLKTQGADALKALIPNARSLTDILVAGVAAQFDLTTPGGKARGAEQMLQMLDKIPDQLAKEFYLRELADQVQLPIERLYAQLREVHSQQKPRFAPGAPSPLNTQDESAAPAEFETYQDFRAPNIRHAESCLLTLALQNAESARALADLLTEDLLSDAPVAKALQELLDMSLNGEWFDGAQFYEHLGDVAWRNDAELTRILMAAPQLKPEERLQAQTECVQELQKHHQQRQIRILLQELKQEQDPEQQKVIVEKLRALREQL